jgi:protein-disulfide isomerase
MRSRTETFATYAVLIAAVCVAAANVHREFFRRAATGLREPVAAPTYMSTWKELLGVGIRDGDSMAKVTVVEFSDLECPVCRRFHSRLREVQQADSGNVAFVFVHYPLPQHRFARPAARAAECADAQGRFSQFINVVYEKQDSLGLKSWTSFASDAGLRDIVGFERCQADAGKPSRIDAGIAVGDKIRVTGTPTVIINGWRFASAPFDSLSSIVSRISLGQTPIAPR